MNTRPLVPRPNLAGPASSILKTKEFSPELPSHRPNCTRRACTPHLVSVAARQNPDAIALSSNGNQMTYAELDHQASKLAAHLQSLGVGPEAVVAIRLERSFSFVIAALAVWKAGGAYLPLDPQWSEERCNFIVEDAQARVLVTQSYLPGRARFVVCLDREESAIACSVMPLAPVVLQRENLACVIYNSTGEPVGVELTHGNLMNLIFWHRRNFAVTSQDRATFLAGLGQDAAMWELWPYLTAAASIAISPDSLRTSPDLLRDWICAQNVTVSLVPAALAEQLISAIWPETTKLRLLLTNGSPLHCHPPSNLPFQLVNHYGSTECTGVMTSGAVPVANTFVYLLNEKFQPVAPGQTGEVFVGGTSVARGYRNRPGLTSKRFFDDPVRGRIYRTGDFASLRSDGQLLVRSRAGAQQPDRIAGALSAHPSVATCAVVARSIANGNTQLVAYVVPKANTEASAEDLRQFLAQRLPESPEPAAFVRMDTLPVDSSALPAPSPYNILSPSDYHAPDSPIELALAQILRELLDLRRVSLTDNFFLLEGNIELGPQLLARIRERFDIQLSLVDLFEAQTVGKLAAMVEDTLVYKHAAMTGEEARRLLAEIPS